MSIQIHWHEGLFLQPHHLQLAQGIVRDQFHAERRLGWPFPYGVIEARLSQDELENKRIRFDKLRVIMPSGLEVNYPENAELPSLDIKTDLAKGPAGFNVYLGVPLWFKDRANSFPPGQEPDPRVKLLYRLKEVERADENTGENPKPIQFRMINARLLLDYDDRSDMEVVPLLRIKPAVGEEIGLPRQDPEFVPPCLVMSGSPALRELVRDLVAQVEASRKELVIQVARSGFTIDTLRGVQFEQLMRLRTLNRFSASLPALIALPNIAPFQFYLGLRELLAELAALYPDRDPFECAPYNHDNPYPCFRELSVKIRAFLRGAVAPSYLKLAFKESEGLLLAAFNEEHFSQPNAYYLGVKTKVDPTALARCVENGDLFKIMPKSLARAAIYGIQVKEERYPPMELPAQADLHYFRLLVTESARRWQLIKDEKAAVINWKGTEIDLTGADFTLYMTVPSTATKP